VTKLQTMTAVLGAALTAAAGCGGSGGGAPGGGTGGTAGRGIAGETGTGGIAGFIGAGGGAPAADAGGAAADGGTDAMNPPVARVVIQQQDFALAPSGAATLTAQAFDAAGLPSPAAITWRSSNTAVATFAGAVVTAVAVGNTQLTAVAGGVASSPVNLWVNPPGNSAGLISQAVVAGTISSGDALVYLVYALFGDPRLPGNFLPTPGTPVPIDDLLMFDVANQFASLAPEQQAEIGPYFAPPAYVPPPPVTPAGTFAAGGPTPRPGFCSGWTTSSDWVSVSSAHFKVWRNNTTGTWTSAMVAAVSAAAEGAYDTLVTAGGFQAPLDDSLFADACYGGDGKVDIYLSEDVLGPMAVTEPMGPTDSGQTMGTYVVLSRDLAALPATAPALKETVTHEFMHTVQYSYPNMGLESYRWTRDSSAVWATQVVTPADLHYQSYASSFMQWAQEPLFFPNQYCAEKPGPECFGDFNADLKMYGGYLFWQYLTKTNNPNFVRTMFANAQFQGDAVNDVDFLLSGAGGLTTVWPQFVLALWNEDPVPSGTSFKGWDGLMDSLDDPSAIQIVDLAGAADGSIPAQALNGPTVLAADKMTQVGVPELSAAFDHYAFRASVHTVAFFNGYSQNLTTTPFGVGVPPTQRDVGSIYISYDNVTADQAKGRHLWAMKKINGVWSAPEDWTNQHIVTFCRDNAAERIQELVLLYSNGNFTNSRAGSYEDNALGPIGDKKTTLVASPMPCGKYTGIASAELNHPAGQDSTDVFDITGTLDATFVGAPRISAVTLANGTGTTLWSWRFTADPTTIAFTSMANGMLPSCGAGYQFNDSHAFDATFYPEPPYFDSLFAVPGGPGESAYVGSGRGLQWIAHQCNGADKLLPAINSFDFDLDQTELQKIDLVNLKLSSGTAGADGPVADPGAYTNPGSVTNRWNFGAVIEPDAPPAAP
jgi:hypothetical protein